MLAKVQPRRPCACRRAPRRRSVGARAGQRAMKINGRDNCFFKAHRIFRAFVFALLLQRPAQNLPLNPSR